MIDRRPTANADAATPEDLSGHRKLWAYVIHEQFGLAINTRSMRRPHEVDAARRWFGSGDFFFVCALAGLDGHWILSGVRREFAKRGIS